MDAWCRAHNPRCELRVAIVPTREEVQRQGQQQVSPIAAQVLEICTRLGIPALDLAPGLVRAWRARAQAATDVTPLYFPRDGHWAAAGHSAAAQTLLESWTWGAAAEGLSVPPRRP